MDSLIYKRMLSLAVIIVTFISINYVHAQSVGGKWKGAIQIHGQELIIITHLQQNQDRYSGTIDIPQQRAQGIPLQKIKITPDSIHYEFPAGPGRASFNGTFISRDSIHGTFIQSGQHFPFYLNKMAQKDTVSKVSNPKKYREISLVFSHDSLKIGGTLTEPKQGGNYPLLILISGSGAQNRNEEIFGFEPFKKIAGYLSNRGIAVFRYDDRGIGQSTGTLRDVNIAGLAEDVRVLVDSLEQRPEINNQKIGLLGHSEGGEIATYLAARDNRISYIILMSAPAYPGSDIILQQIQNINGRKGVPDSTVKQTLVLENNILDVAKNDSGRDNMHKMLLKMTMDQLNKLPDSDKKQIGNLNDFAQKRVNAQIKQIRNKHFRSFITYDPANDFQKLNIPVLAFFGEKDKQVDEQKNSKRMKEYLQKGGSKYKLEVIPGANHLYQKANTGLPTEYGSLKPDFVPGFLDSLHTWIQKTVNTDQ